MRYYLLGSFKGKDGSIKYFAYSDEGFCSIDIKSLLDSDEVGILNSYSSFDIKEVSKVRNKDGSLRKSYSVREVEEYGYISYNHSMFINNISVGVIGKVSFYSEGCTSLYVLVNVKGIIYLLEDNDKNIDFLINYSHIKAVEVGYNVIPTSSYYTDNIEIYLVYDDESSKFVYFDVLGLIANMGRCKGFTSISIFNESDGSVSMGCVSYRDKIAIRDNIEYENRGNSFMIGYNGFEYIFSYDTVKEGFVYKKLKLED